SGWKRRAQLAKPRARRRDRGPHGPPSVNSEAKRMFGFGSSKSIVGLDIGSSSIKAVELKKVKGEIQVAHLGVERLGSDIVVDSMIVDSGSVSSAISKLFSDRKFSSRLVATAVSGHSVIVKKISMQTVPENEVPDLLQTE